MSDDRDRQEALEYAVRAVATCLGAIDPESLTLSGGLEVLHMLKAVLEHPEVML